MDPRLEAGFTRVSPAAFRAHLDFLARRGVRARSLSDLFDSPGEGTPLEASSEPRRHPATPSAHTSIGLTFDDAYEGLIAHALPLLAAHGFTATAFPPVDYIGRDNAWDAGRFGFRRRHMDRQQLRDWIAAGGEVGCHGAGHRHPRLLRLVELRREVIDAKARLEEMIGEPVRWFSPPFGWYDRPLLDLAAEAGYDGVAVTRLRRGVAAPEGLRLVPRLTVYWGDGPRTLAVKLNPAHPLHRLELARLALFGAGSWGTAAVQAAQRSPRPTSGGD